MPRQETRSARICRAFKSAQVDKGYTQQDIAKRLGVDQSTVSKWYHQPDSMTIGSLRLLCTVLSISPQEIMLIE